MHYKIQEGQSRQNMQGAQKRQNKIQKEIQNRPKEVQGQIELHRRKESQRQDKMKYRLADSIKECMKSEVYPLSRTFF